MQVKYRWERESEEHLLAQDTAVHKWPASCLFAGTDPPRYALVLPAASAGSLGRHLRGAHAAPTRRGELRAIHTL